MIYGLAAVLAWSTVATAFKMTLRHVDFFQLLFLANIASVVAIGCVLLVQRKLALVLRVTRKQYLGAAGLGLLIWLGVWARTFWIRRQLGRQAKSTPQGTTGASTDKQVIETEYTVISRNQDS